MAKKCEHECLKKMCIRWRKKIDKYWEECNLVLAVAIFFNPRCKLHIVNYFYTQVYDEDIVVGRISMVQKMLEDI